MPVVKATSNFKYEVCRFLILFPPPGTGKNNHLLLDVIAENTTVWLRCLHSLLIQKAIFKRSYSQSLPGCEVYHCYWNTNVYQLPKAESHHKSNSVLFHVNISFHYFIISMKIKPFGFLRHQHNSRNKYMIQLSFIWTT